MKNWKLLVVAISGLFALTACGADITDVSDIGALSQEQLQSFSSTQTSTPINDYNSIVTKFVSDVQKLNVKLDDQKLQRIYTQRNAVPTGKFADRPALNLTSEANLETHFQKHKKEFKGVTTKDMYLQRAIEFNKRKADTIGYYFDSTSFDKGYQSNVIKYDLKTHELSAMRDNGDITTYYTSDAPSSKRFVKVPDNFTLK